ncbi:hypothetical protein E3P84_02887 [Wallemia ichthyophaga]|nr:hypothetical protein E3P84_02887 [Wallemia ichthyophaga]TIB40669.1 hypothetical protein E3P83_02776 [Wallemia ichthyophaga]
MTEMSEQAKLDQFISQKPQQKYKFDGKLESDNVLVCRSDNDCIELEIKRNNMINMMNVLESIYADELTVLSDNKLSIKLDSEEVEGEDTISTNLSVNYTPKYPDELPEFEIDVLEGDLGDEDVQNLHNDLVDLDSLSDLLLNRLKSKQQVESDKKQAEIEAELERTRGTQLTIQNFNEWRINFIKERNAKLEEAEEAQLQKLNNKDREELKRWNTRKSGKQLFEKDTTLANSDSNLINVNDKVVDKREYQGVEGDDDELGKGQHGRVREAIDTETNERFAVKMVDRAPKKRLLGSKSRPSTAENHLRKPTDNKICKEIAILKKLHHENVVQLKEIIDDGGSKTIYMILELMKGGEIQWKNEHSLPTMTVNQARSTLTDVILGLEYLHYQGIIHRDIKPANLLWNDSKKVKISDFGVSHFSYALSAQSPDQSPLFTLSSTTNNSSTQLDSSTPNSPTSSEEPLFTDQDLAKTAGSPAFFAPELCFQRSSQFDSKRPRITNAIDVWALGVTLYCLLFGKVPFTAENEFALFNVIPAQPVEYPPYAGADQLSLKDSEEGKQLRDLLNKLFEKDPTKRIKLAQVKSHPWILRGIHEPSEWLKHTDVNASPAVQVTNEEVESALNFRTRLKRGWRHIANAFNAATGATGVPRRGSVNSNNYNPYQYHSQSDLDEHNDDNNPYAPTSAVKQFYNADLSPATNQQTLKQRRLSSLDSSSNSNNAAPNLQPPTHLSRAASLSSQSSRAHKSDPSSRRQSMNHLQLNAAQSPRSSLSNEIGTSSPNVTQPPQFTQVTAPTPIPMMRGNSDTVTLSNSSSTGDFDEQPTVSRSSAASPAASTGKRGTLRGFLKGLTLGNRKTSVSSNTSAPTRFASFSDHHTEREKREKEIRQKQQGEREMHKASISSLSPTSQQQTPAILHAAPPSPHSPVAESLYDDDVDIDVQLSGHSDSSDEEEDSDQLLALAHSHSHSSHLRSSIAMGDEEESDDGAESSDASELNQPTQYWSNRGDGWRHVGIDGVYDLNETGDRDREDKEAVMGLNSAVSGDDATSTSTSTPTPNVHSEHTYSEHSNHSGHSEHSKQDSTPLAHNNSTANESMTDTASLVTFKMKRPREEQTRAQEEQQLQEGHLHVNTLQPYPSHPSHPSHPSYYAHHAHHEYDSNSSSSSQSSESEEGDTLEITPRRSRNSSFAITSRSPSMSLSPTKLGQAAILAAPPAPTAAPAPPPPTHGDASERVDE